PHRYKLNSLRLKNSGLFRFGTSEEHDRAASVFVIKYRGLNGSVKSAVNQNSEGIPSPHTTNCQLRIVKCRCSPPYNYCIILRTKLMHDSTRFFCRYPFRSAILLRNESVACLCNLQSDKRDTRRNIFNKSLVKLFSLRLQNTCHNFHSRITKIVKAFSSYDRVWVAHRRDDFDNSFIDNGIHTWRSLAVMNTRLKIYKQCRPAKVWMAYMCILNCINLSVRIPEFT